MTTTEDEGVLLASEAGEKTVLDQIDEACACLRAEAIDLSGMLYATRAGSKLEETLESIAKKACDCLEEIQEMNELLRRSGFDAFDGAGEYVELPLRPRHLRLLEPSEPV